MVSEVLDNVPLLQNCVQQANKEASSHRPLPILLSAQACPEFRHPVSLLLDNSTPDKAHRSCRKLIGLHTSSATRKHKLYKRGPIKLGKTVNSDGHNPTANLCVIHHLSGLQGFLPILVSHSAKAPVQKETGYNRPEMCRKETEHCPNRCASRALACLSISRCLNCKQAYECAPQSGIYSQEREDACKRQTQHISVPGPVLSFYVNPKCHRGNYRERPVASMITSALTTPGV